jgi:hypothetical protein
VYCYGCLSPTEGAALLDEQFRLAHRYRNGLCEIERRRRERISSVQFQHGDLGRLLQVIDHLETTIQEARITARAARGGKGDNERLALARSTIQWAQADLAVLRLIRAAHKAVSRDKEDLRAAYKEVEEQTKNEVRALRSGDQAPYWGTYLVVERAAESWRKAREAPRFERYDGTGRAAVQLQGGLTTAEALTFADPFLRILPARQLMPPADLNSRRRLARAIAYAVVHFCRCGDMTDPNETHRQVSIRIGSTGRSPVWATLPVYLHRPLPEDGRITWAWVIRRRVGVRYRYELQITIESSAFTAPQKAQSGPTIALDIGARDLVTGDTRVAYWLDSDGKHDELVLPRFRRSSPTRRVRDRPLVPNDLSKVEEIESIRDKRLDAIRGLLAEYATMPWLPEPLRERIAPVARWRSPLRFGALLRDWERHEHDAVAYAKLAAFWRKDRHLCDWAANERRRYYARQKTLYRDFAARVAGSYATIVIAKRDYRLEGRPPERAKTTEGRAARKIMRLAAPGKLRSCILAAAHARGARVIEAALEGDTAWAVDSKVAERLLKVGLSASATSADSSLSETVAKPAVRRRSRLGNRERPDSDVAPDVSVDKLRLV